MSAHEHEHDRLWDPAEAGGEHEALLGELEPLLAPLKASAPPLLELPARELAQGQSDDAAPAAAPSTRRGLLVALVSLAALLALWFAWRTPPPDLADPAPIPQLAVAPQPEPWRIEKLEGEDHCRAPEELADTDAPAPTDPDALGTGSSLERGDSLKLGEGASARLSSGGAQLELHPLSELENADGVLTLLAGRAWVDFPAREAGTRWRLSAGPLELETRAARFMVSVQPANIELELVTGELSIVGPAHSVSAHAGQLCRASFAGGPLELLRAIECSE